MTLFKHLPNVTVHSAFVVYNKMNLSNRLSYRFDLVKALVVTNKSQIPTSGVGNHQSILCQSGFWRGISLRRFLQQGRRQNYKKDV
jgi:hypothetical protein